MQKLLHSSDLKIFDFALRDTNWSECAENASLLLRIVRTTGRVSGSRDNYDNYAVHYRLPHKFSSRYTGDGINTEILFRNKAYDIPQIAIVRNRLQDLRLSRRWRWLCSSSGLWRHVDSQVVTSISEKHSVFTTSLVSPKLWYLRVYTS
jgi:hypothetical protein